MSFNRFNDIAIDHINQMADDIRTVKGKSVSIKPLILTTYANIFTEYFTSRVFDRNDTKFQQMIKNFDKVFWEVNHGSIADFLPFLNLFNLKRLKEMAKWSRDIRTFVLENIIVDRYETWNVDNEPSDYIESLIDHVKKNLKPNIKFDTVRNIFKYKNYFLIIF